MIAQLAAAMLIGAIRQEPTPPKVLDLKTFAQAMEPLAKAATYRIEGQPIILHFSSLSMFPVLFGRKMHGCVDRLKMFFKTHERFRKLLRYY